MAKHWDYSEAATHTCGLMNCCACGKQITEGQFRWRETEAAYVTQHRACSANDPAWARMDKEAADRAGFDQRRRAAFAAFVKEFGEPHDLLEAAG